MSRVVDERRYLILKFCEHGEAWQAEQRRIADEAKRVIVAHARPG